MLSVIHEKRRLKAEGVNSGGLPINKILHLTKAAKTMSTLELWSIHAK